jgi:hypothetical protein
MTSTMRRWMSPGLLPFFPIVIAPICPELGHDSSGGDSRMGGSDLPAEKGGADTGDEDQLVGGTNNRDNLWAILRETPVNRGSTDVLL